MKLYITGPVGSGKSTLARAISVRTGVAFFSLDDVVHEPLPEGKGNRKRSPQARDRMFREILSRSDFIVEDTGRACFEAAMREAEAIILLEPRPHVRRARIFRRWIKQNLGLEACSYRPDWKMLQSMFRWSQSYEDGSDGLRARLAAFSDKLVVLRMPCEVRAYLNRFL